MKNAIRNLSGLTLLGVMLFATNMTRAQTAATSTNAPPSGGHHGMDFLTESEKQELHKAHDLAVAADASLGRDEKSLMDEMKKAQVSGEKLSDDLMAKMHAFREKMDAAMIKADSDVATIIAKIKAHHGPQGGPGGPPPPSNK